MEDVAILSAIFDDDEDDEEQEGEHLVITWDSRWE